MTRVLIIGAGIIGAALAEASSRRGADVIVIDSGDAGDGTTTSSLAWLNANNRHPVSYHELAVAALAEWAALADRYDQPDWYQPTGNLTWAVASKQQTDLASRVARLESLGYPVERLAHAQARRLEPELQIRRNAEIAFYPTEGHVDGKDATVALLNKAQASGCVLRENTPVAALKINGGEVDAITLASGEELTADVYVCCAGWRSNELLAAAGAPVRLLPATEPDAKPPCLVVTASSRPGLVNRIVHAPGLNLRPSAQEAIHLEASDINARTDTHTPPAVLADLANELFQRAHQLVPRLSNEHLEDWRVCVRPMPADGHPITGWATGVTNLYLTVTHSGITLAPLLAKLATNEILDRTTAHQLRPYRPDRGIAQ